MSAKKITAKNVAALSTDELIELLHTALAPRLASVDPKDLVFVSPSPTVPGKSIVKIGGQRVSAVQASNLEKEAQMIRNMDLFRLMTATLTEYAHRMMFAKAKSFDDMRSGKMLLYAISIIEQIVKGCANIHSTQLSTSTARKAGL